MNKIIATISDIKQMPWTEKYVRAKVQTIEDATVFMELMIRQFNATLSPNEEPRHLVSVTLEPISPKEAKDMGDWDYDHNKSENPFPPGELADAWQEGYDAAEDFDTDYDDGGEDDENED